MTALFKEGHDQIRCGLSIEGRRRAGRPCGGDHGMMGKRRGGPMVLVDDAGRRCPAAMAEEARSGAER